MASSNTDRPRTPNFGEFREIQPEIVIPVTEQPAREPPTKPTTPTMNSELLMAARHGDSKRLKGLLEEKDAAAAMAQAVVLEVDRPTPSAAALLLAGVTSEGDSALHVVAACGENEAFLDCADVIYGKARHLLLARNSNGHTPLHCAARAGRVTMVSRLIDMARGEGEGTSSGSDQRERVKELLRAQNKREETALHEAIRSNKEELVDKLMSEDAELARIPSDGTSPLYLAISLRRYSIARKLHEKDKDLSYAGPQRQNALHVAVLSGKVPTEMVLGWKEGLAKQGDKDGRTPLHFAASMGRPHQVTVIPQLLKADKSSVYQPDNKGLYPLHLAAMGGIVQLPAVKLLIDGCPDCASLRDSKGRTFLHVAVNSRSASVVAFASLVPGLLRVMNMQDNNGNTVLHRAVQVCHIRIFFFLLNDRRVLLDIKNNKGQTPLDLSRLNTQLRGHMYPANPSCLMIWSLTYAGAPRGDGPQDGLKELRIQKREREKLSAIYKESAQSFNTGAVLIVTVTFAATFTMPGGYISADDHTKGGTPTFAGTYFFDAFAIANTLAFIFSGMATFGLMYASYAPLDFSVREVCTLSSLHLLHLAVRCVGAAFLSGTYVMLARVTPKIVIVILIIAVLGLIYINFEVLMLAWMTLTLLIRRDFSAAVKAGLHTVLTASWLSWPLAAICILPAIFKSHRST